MIIDNNEIVIAKENIAVIKILEIKERFSFSVGKFLKSFPLFWKLVPGKYETFVNRNRTIIPKDREGIGKIKGYSPSFIEEGWVYSLYYLGSDKKISEEKMRKLLDGKRADRKLFIVQAIIPKYCQYVPGKNVTGDFITLGSDMISINKVLYWRENISDLEKEVCKQKIGIK